MEIKTRKIDESGIDHPQIIWIRGTTWCLAITLGYRIEPNIEAGRARIDADIRLIHVSMIIDGVVLDDRALNIRKQPHCKLCSAVRRHHGVVDDADIPHRADVARV